jgi:hypothetical protein
LTINLKQEFENPLAFKMYFIEALQPCYCLIIGCKNSIKS